MDKSFALFNLKRRALLMLQKGYSLNNIRKEMMLAKYFGASEAEINQALEEARRDFKTGGEM